MITEKTIVATIEIHPNGQIFLREDRIILDDNEVELTRMHHRRVLNPGDSINVMDPRVQAITNVLWTQQVIDDFRTELANKLRPPGVKP